MDGSEPPPQVEDTAEWDGLSPEDRQGMLLAIEARTLGSRGQKHGNDVGAVIVRPSGGAEGEDAWRVVSWGCARTLTSAPVDPEAPLEDAGDGTGAGKTKKRKTKGGDNKIDIHAEMDAVAHAALASPFPFFALAERLQLDTVLRVEPEQLPAPPAAALATPRGFDLVLSPTREMASDLFRAHGGQPRCSAYTHRQARARGGKAQMIF